ncbi:PREDICTED: beta-galactosidase-like isoform X2 [Priapulus caudatus]|uniref:Beta-galactosidase n=1 Tax=Priapulus caudatus TaxID=37621 RepID=A0ABM1DQ89_PRICU|nr:PREDICTED: beta-galactosidase-like isoform X2 [Priapulus caudatus]
MKLDTVCLHFLTVALTITNTVIWGGSESLRSFTIDYDNDTFLKDRKPFHYMAGALHYYRVPRIYWKDRMERMQAMGLNALQTYISWNMHEPQTEQYRFEGENDFESFLWLAHEHGFVVILRPGPYIDAERDMGGLPYWLLSVNASMALRTSDPQYLYYVDRWFDVLMPKIKPLLYSNGGPVVMVQVENEYGSYYACDDSYMNHLHVKLKTHLGNDVVYFTTDGASPYYLKCGKQPGIYATVDFGALPMNDTMERLEEVFSSKIKYEPRGPLVNSEFYPGWIDHWGEPHATVPAQLVARTMYEMLAIRACFTVYVICGGTSFGFYNGANYDEEKKAFEPSPTSYDFDAPITEGGDFTMKYFLLRSVIQQYIDFNLPAVPPPMPKFPYGAVSMKLIGSIYDVLDDLCKDGSNKSLYPQSFEQLGQDYGFVLYRTKVPAFDSFPILLDLTHVRDRAYILVDQFPVGILSRMDGSYAIQLPKLKQGQQLDILVENQGRICYGPLINDVKGLIWNVTMNNRTLTNWEMFSLPFNATPSWFTSAYDSRVKSSADTASQSFAATHSPASSRDDEAVSDGLEDETASQSQSSSPLEGERLDANVRALEMLARLLRTREHERSLERLKRRGETLVRPPPSLLQSGAPARAVFTQAIRYYYAGLPLPATGHPVPSFYTGAFIVPGHIKSPQDSYLRLNGWYKGVAFVNGFNVGRYWPVMGPQVTLYVPAHALKSHPQVNVLVLFELEWSPCTAADDAADEDDDGTTAEFGDGVESGNRDLTACKVEFVTKHVIDGPVFRAWDGGWYRP